MTEKLVALSGELAALVREARPSIVQVRARHGGPSTGVVWSADGAVVTTEHAVERDEGIEVTLADGTTVKATVTGRDPRTDVAVLAADATGLAVPAWAALDGVEVGNLGLVLARPGRTVRATLGIVSALGEEWHPPRGGRIDNYVETDAEMGPGFSGGLFVDAGGRALGMMSSALYRGRSIAIPTSTLKRVVASLLEHGEVQRGYLGIGVHPVRLKSRQALVIVSVQEGSPADRAGLFVGDVLLAFDGKETTHVMELFELLDDQRVGKTLTARILRGGEQRDLSVTVGTRA
jgi:serine protease DegQ